MMKKILLVCCHDFEKTSGGQESCLKNRIDYFSKKYEIDVLMVSNEEKEAHLYGNVQIDYCKYPSFFEKIKQVFILFFKKIPFQTGLTISRELKHKLKKNLARKNYDIVVFDMIRLADLYKIVKKSTNAKIVLDLVDIISKRYYYSKGNILGQSRNNNKFLSHVLKFGIIKKFILRVERHRLEKSEKFYCNIFDAILLISESETRELILKTGKNNIYNLPMLISEKNFDVPKMYEKKEKIILGFAGQLKTPANYESLINILDNILPNLDFSFNFVIIGNAPNDLIKKYSSNNVSFLGFVEDFKAEMKKIDIFLCPMVFGTGIKTKILEAMAIGLPVFTNYVGIEGINVSNGDNIFVANCNEEIIEQLNTSINDCGLINKVARNGQKYVSMHHSETVVDSAFINIISSIC
ncbi:MAG: glycosyltransferase family 4 protein [Clostridia bacterium]|nr:glycosyltransferase family 4 protein [Clostridia bacterium]